MTTKRKDGERLWTVHDIDSKDQPEYGPFFSEEQAHAFGSLLGNENHTYCVVEIRDPESVRFNLIERLAHYENETVPRNTLLTFEGRIKAIVADDQRTTRLTLDELLVDVKKFAVIGCGADPQSLASVAARRILRLCDQAELLRSYAEMASPYLQQHPGFLMCRDCKRANPESEMKNPGCGFNVCPPCYAHRSSPASELVVKL